MKRDIIFTAVAILALVAIETANATEPKRHRWPKPTELNSNSFDDNKQGWGGAYGCVEDPTTPPSPIPLPPGFPDIGRLLPPGFGNLFPPGFPGIGNGGGMIPSTVTVTAKESKGISKCMNDHPKAKECYAQILNSYATDTLHLDSECCKMVVLMDDECNDVVYGIFKSAFFPRLLQYSCHLKNKH
ncbi:PREDICTED: uncharacterized protein LOC104806833 [Tarenaya hassleriana]|uniref:uncharacterized protein LOC104806833 n=1 Tax=Tarenaya hassleriana TaxID=28532 RepID=UPI0008FD66C0|nr:PREDICTED: uncharacterized protein LOC104806833 [Tarenaya hassleriana]